MNQADIRVKCAQEKVWRNIQQGMQCGPACLKGLAETYEVSVCQEIEWESFLFTKGACVYDRCAAFQASAVLVGLWYGRTTPDIPRNRYREAMKVISEIFREQLGGYRCSEFRCCESENQKEIMDKIINATVEGLELVRENDSKKYF